MALIAKDKGGGDFEPMAAGTHPARCCGIWDLGTHYEQGQGWAKSIHKILVQFEFPKQRIEIDGEDLPRVLSQKFTLSLHQKSNLRPMLEAWREKSFTQEELDGFEVRNVLGAPCKILVLHEKSKDGTKTYANIKQVNKFPKEEMKPEFTITPVFYDIEEHGINIPEGTPEWIQDLITSSDEYRELSGEGMVYQGPERDYEGPADDDDIPF